MVFSRHRRSICCALALVAAIVAPMLANCALACEPGQTNVECATVAGARHEASFTGYPFVDFFTGGGSYMPRTHCLMTPSGQIDWPWIAALLVLTTTVIVAYLRIFLFWMRSFFNEQHRDRNAKLFDLAAIFLWCAICGYAMSILMFFWPGYRLLAVFLVVLNIFSWRFCWNLEPFRTAFAANRLERELRESMESRAKELEQLVALRTREAEEARAIAEAASRSKGEFLANMSHEIRTPMTAILGFADLLQDDLEQPHDAAALVSGMEHIGTIKRHGAHLLAVINDILDLSKIEAGKMTFECVPTNIRALVNEIAALLSVRAAERKLDLIVACAPSVPRWVLTDPTRLRQILLNLIGNALKFTDTGSVTLAVRLEAAESSLCFEVRDTGIGMSGAEIGRLFGEFTQADTSITRRYGGTGLGLRISKRLANMLGGDISVTSEVGVGSAFTARIEAIPVDAADHIEPRMTARPNEVPAAQQQLAGVRVLMAEDGVDNRRLVARMLEKQGAVVTLAENGRMAIECCTVDGTVDGALIEPSPFDLVLMDMQMPEVDGYTATRLLREKRCELPIIALTAHAMTGDREQCLAAGCSDYLSKPIDRAALIATIAGQVSVAT